MDPTLKKRSFKYDRVMSRVLNHTVSSLKSSSFVTRHEIPSSVAVGAKLFIPNVNFGDFSELPIVLNEVPQSDHENLRRKFVKKPRKTIKSLDPALPPRHVMIKHQALNSKSSVRLQESAPSILSNNREKWSHCVASKCNSRLKDIKDEIKAFKDKEKTMRLQSLFRRCGVMLDNVGNVTEDKAVQVQAMEMRMDDTEQIQIR